MSGRWIWLSFPLNVEGPRPPAIPAPSLTPLMTIARDGAAVQTLCLASHTGTHLDAPRHVVEGGLSIGDFRPEEMVFSRPEEREGRHIEKTWGGTVVCRLPGHFKPGNAGCRDRAQPE
jgi:hypothetical protein